MKNPCKTHLANNYLGLFTVREVFDNHNYTVKDSVGNQKRLHNNGLRLFTE